MDWDDAPCALRAELFEEGGCGNGVARRERVRIEQRTADDTGRNDTEAPAENLRGPPDNSAAREGAEIGDDLRDGNLGNPCLSVPRKGPREDG